MQKLVVLLLHVSDIHMTYLQAELPAAAVLESPSRQCGMRGSCWLRARGAFLGFDCFD
jgi:hypothetical protein